MRMKKPLPIGVDNFEKILEDGYCYVDKTMLIKELLDLKGEVNLFLRPRRFGCPEDDGYIKWSAVPYHQLL